MDASGGWWRRAACQDSPIDFLANAEAQEPDPAAKAICDGDPETGQPPCPVRVECMATALDGDEWGVRAGTSHWQRRQLRRRYRRAMCPVCRVEGGILIELGTAQACLTCAVSWRATPAKVPGGGLAASNGR
jgi:hypothetical protein